MAGTAPASARTGLREGELSEVIFCLLQRAAFACINFLGNTELAEIRSPLFAYLTNCGGPWSGGMAYREMKRFDLQIERRLKK
jgi:hypothetical protein